MSKFSLFIPKLILQGYAVYCGLLIYRGNLVNEEIKSRVCDLTLISLTQSILLILALHFQWRDDAIFEDSSDSEGQ